MEKLPTTPKITEWIQRKSNDQSENYLKEPQTHASQLSSSLSNDRAKDSPMSSPSTRSKDRLYRDSFEIRRKRELEMKLFEQAEKEAREIRVSKNTANLAFTHWSKRTAKCFKSCDSFDSHDKTVSVDDCLKVFSDLGFLTQASLINGTIRNGVVWNDALTKLLVAEVGNGSDRIMLSRLVMLLSEVIGESIEKQNVSVFLELDLTESVEFSAELVLALRDLIRCPVTAAKDFCGSPQEMKKVTVNLSEFLERQKKDEKERNERMSERLKHGQAEFSKTFTFKPKLNASNTSPVKKKMSPSQSMDSHERLFEEARYRQEKLLSKKIEYNVTQEEALKEQCTFSPRTNKFIGSPVKSAISENDFWAIKHVDRLEKGRMEKEELQARFDNLGKVTRLSETEKLNVSSEVGMTTPKHKSRNCLHQIRVILSENKSVIVQLFPGDNGQAVAEEFGSKFHVSSQDLRMLEMAFTQALSISSDADENVHKSHVWDSKKQMWSSEQNLDNYE